MNGAVAAHLVLWGAFGAVAWRDERRAASRTAGIRVVDANRIRLSRWLVTTRNWASGLVRRRADSGKRKRTMSKHGSADDMIARKIADRYGISTTAAAAMWADVQASGTESPYVREVAVVLTDVACSIAVAVRPVVRAYAAAFRGFVETHGPDLRRHLELVEGGRRD